MQLERLWYETSPYLYLVAGTAAALDARGSMLLAASGMALFVLAATVIGLRWIYRQGTTHAMRDDFDESGYVNLITQELYYDDRRMSQTRGRGSNALDGLSGGVRKH